MADLSNIEDELIHVQISRGDLTKREEYEKLHSGELFWQAQNDSNLNIPQSEGILYIADPKVDGASQPIPIASSRTLNALTFRGYLNHNHYTLTDPIFKNVKKYDFFIFEEDAPDFSAFGNEPRYKKGDFLLITDITTNDKNITTSFEYTKMATGVDDAYKLYFKTQLTTNNFNDINVGDSLDYLYVNKLQYRGNIDLDTLKDRTIDIEPGFIFQVANSGIIQNLKVNKNDLLVVNEDRTWSRIEIKTQLEDIDVYLDTNQFYPTQQNYVNQYQYNSLQDLLFLLAKEKAQLDENGKVLITQLPSYVMSGLKYNGLWDPIIDNNLNYNLMENQKPFPTPDRGNETLNTLSVGDYWIVATDHINIQYVDKTVQDTEGNYVRIIELNKGDWIIYSYDPDYDANLDPNPATVKKYKFLVVDNSERISLLNFYTNAYVANNKVIPFDETKVGKTGIIEFGAAYKLGLYEDASGKMVIGGENLIDQAKDVLAVPTSIPRYINSSLNENTLEPTQLYALENRILVLTDFEVGYPNQQYTSRFNGDVVLEAKYGETDLPSQIIGRHWKNGTLHEQQTLTFSKFFQNNSTITLPRDTSKLTGFKVTETYKPNHVLKALLDDEGKVSEFLKDTQIEDNENQQYVSFHTENVLVKNQLSLRKLIFGDFYNPADIHNCNSLNDNRKVEILINDYQPNEDIVVILPKESGVLINNYMLKQYISGDVDYLPYYESVDSTGQLHLKNSYLKKDETQISVIQNVIRHDSSSKAKTNTTSLEDFTVGTDSSPKNLHVTGDIFVGNIDEKPTKFTLKNYLYIEEAINKDQRTNINKVYRKFKDVQLPIDEGVLLTSRSLVTGGNYWNTPESDLPEAHPDTSEEIITGGSTSGTPQTPTPTNPNPGGVSVSEEIVELINYLTTQNAQNAQEILYFKNTITAFEDTMESYTESIDRVYNDLYSEEVENNLEAIRSYINQFKNDFIATDGVYNKYIIEAYNTSQQHKTSKEETIIEVTQEEYDNLTPLPNQTYLIKDTGNDITSILFNTIYPIGVIYTQYPNTLPPNILFPTTTWELLDYGGAFLRTSGGKAQNFNNQENAQTEQLPNVRGTFQGYGKNGYVGICGNYKGDGMHAGETSTSQWWSKEAGGGTITANTGFYTSLSTGQTNADGETYKDPTESAYVDGGEVRPSNYTIQIWKRIQ